MNREKKWDKIFNAFVKLSQNLHDERQFLEDKIKSMHDTIHEMKLMVKFESRKAELLLGMKEKEAVVYKHRYESTNDDLADFREWFDYLSQKCSESSGVSNDVSNEGEGSRNKALQAEVRKLKSDIGTYKFEKNSEISRLVDEKKLVWKQLEYTENNFTEQLKKKDEEVEQANQKMQTLAMSNEVLREDFNKKESELVQKSEEISKLLKEIELLKSRSGNRTLQTTRIKPSAHKSTGGKAPRRRLTSSEGRSRSSKRKRVDV